MATITSTLKMIDAMSNPINSAVLQMERLIASAERVNKVMASAPAATPNLPAVTGAQQRVISQQQQIIHMTQVIQNNYNQINNTVNHHNRTLNQTVSHMHQAAKEQERIERSVKETANSGSGLLRSLRGMAAAYLTIEGARRVGAATIGAAMQQQQLADMFIARTGDEAVGRAMFQQFKTEALAAGQDVAKALQSTMSFFSMTQNTAQLTKLNNLAQRLNAFDSAGNGLEGAAFALKEALSGDIVSLAERFNMSKADIRAFKIVDFANKGDIDGFITAFDKLLEKQRMGQEAYEKMLESPAKQFEIFQNNMRSGFANAGQAAVQALLPLIAMLNKAAQAGQFQPMLNALSAGLANIANTAVWVANVIGQIYNFFSNNWPTIEPIVWGLVGAFGAYLAISKLTTAATALQTAATTKGTLAFAAMTLATKGLTAAWATLNIVMKANIYILIISLVIGLITWIVKLWQTNDDFAAAMVRAWNWILGKIDQVPIVFQRVANSIVGALEWARVKSLQIMENMINGVIDRVNSLIEKLNKVSGTTITTIAKVEFAATAAAQAEYLKQAGETALASMEESAAAKAVAREQKVLDMLTNRKAKRAAEQTNAAQDSFDFSAWNQQADINRINSVGEVGKIRDSVDIASEDLRLMREVAERNSIQNFVSLAPTVQVTTGPVNKESDIQTIVAGIKTYMETELASSAKGVYNV